MTTLVNASTAGAGGLLLTSDNTGVLALQTASTNALTIGATQLVNIVKDATINTLTVGLGGGAVATNTTVGVNALLSNTTGSNNVAVGNSALYLNTIGYNNTAVGQSALSANTTGAFNTAVGFRTLYSNTTGIQNIAVGVGALQVNTTGCQNVAVGTSALNANTIGDYNVGIGVGALQVNTTGCQNVAVGAGTLQCNTTGVANVAVGQWALNGNITGIQNTAVGYQAVFHSATNNNVGIGYRALYETQTGSGNTGIGTSSLIANVDGGSNTGLGMYALNAYPSFSNTTGLGYNAQVTGSNQLQLGDANTTTYAYGAVANRSDNRDKTAIRDTTLGLSFINALRPVDFKWDMREDYRPLMPEALAGDATEVQIANYEVLMANWLEAVKLNNITHDGSKTRNRYHHGLIAQEVKTVLDNQSIDFGGYQNHAINGGQEAMTIGYTELIAPLIKAIQELNTRLSLLESQ